MRKQQETIGKGSDKMRHVVWIVDEGGIAEVVGFSESEHDVRSNWKL